MPFMTYESSWSSSCRRVKWSQHHQKLLSDEIWSSKIVLNISSTKSFINSQHECTPTKLPISLISSTSNFCMFEVKTSRSIIICVPFVFRQSWNKNISSSHHNLSIFLLLVPLGALIQISCWFHAITFIFVGSMSKPKWNKIFSEESHSISALSFENADGKKRELLKWK